ncbi:MAG: hypothetical protein IKJ11_00275 [Clostridia bacterium]|nr:hypothetical protein [Clostridia bacterium]
MKRLICLFLALCLLLGSTPLALAAYDRTKPPCQTPGHEKNDGMDHNRPKPCWVTGHFACDGLNHEKAACGIWKHFNCDGKDHVAAPCGVEGHYACKGKHEPAVCGVEGHYACSGDHYADVNKYCTAEPKHTRCQSTQEHYCDPENGGCGETYLCSESNSHTTCDMCGLLWCDESLGGHYTRCGNRNHRPCVYSMQGKTWRSSDHPVCHLCGRGKCTGRHGEGACVDLCSQCGAVLKEGKTHRASCGKHYVCISKGLDHSWCSKCGKLKCSDGTATHTCKK